MCDGNTVMDKKYISMWTVRELILFIIGGLAYYGIEILFRGYSHWSMFLLGGLCFVIIGLLNEGLTWKMPLVSQMVLSALIITGLEFLTGCIVNLWLGLGVWDYSDQPYNLLGQICLLFSNLWALLSLVAIYLDDLIRWKLFGFHKPRYTIFM